MMNDIEAPLTLAEMEIVRLERRVQELLAANNYHLERRRMVERDLAMAKIDAEVWHERYHAMRASYLEAERRLNAIECPSLFGETD